MRVRLPALVASGLVAAACGGPSRPPAAARATAAVLDNTADTPADLPIDHAEALTQWRNTGVTGESLEAVLASLPDDPAVRRAMALAVLRGGSLVCEDAIEQYMCGDSSFEMAPLAPTATFDDPCLRRQLALWSLQQLDAADAVDLADVLVELVSMRAPETELQSAAFALLASDDDVLRLALLRHAEPSLAEVEASALHSTEARLFAARQLHLDSAYALLDPTRHHATLVVGLNDTALDSSTRDGLIAQLADDGRADTEAALIELTGDDDCALAMRAAEALLARDPAHASYLPARPSSSDVAEHVRALCMLQHDTDDARRTARLLDWFGDDGLTLTNHEYNDYYDGGADPDPDAAADGELEEDDPWATTVVQEGSQTITIERVRPTEVDPGSVTGVMDGAASCTGLDCSFGDSTITFVSSTDGSLIVESVDTVTYNGCGC